MKPSDNSWIKPQPGRFGCRQQSEAWGQNCSCAPRYEASRQSVADPSAHCPQSPHHSQVSRDTCASPPINETIESMWIWIMDQPTPHPCLDVHLFRNGRWRRQAGSVGAPTLGLLQDAFGRCSRCHRGRHSCRCCRGSAGDSSGRRVVALGRRGCWRPLTPVSRTNRVECLAESCKNLANVNYKFYWSFKGTLINFSMVTYFWLLASFKNVKSKNLNFSQFLVY